MRRFLLNLDTIEIFYLVYLNFHANNWYLNIENDSFCSLNIILFCLKFE